MQVSVEKFSRQKGFSLIEALVAFLLLSVGMLGIASLQTQSIKAGHTASLRSIAVIKTEEILERMRSNRTALTDYISGAGGTGTNHGCNDHTGSIVVCTDPTQMAQQDVYLWKQGLKESLPPDVTTTGSIAVVSPATPGQGLSTVTVTISWLERSTTAQAMAPAMTYTATANICGAQTC